MITLKVSGEASPSFQLAHEMAARELEGIDRVVQERREKMERAGEKRLKELGIEYFKKENEWCFDAISEEKIALPAGWYTWIDGVLHEIRLI